MADPITRAEVEMIAPGDEVRRDLQDPELEYEVEAIVDHQDILIRKGRKKTGDQAREYLVKYVGYPPSFN